MNFRNQSALERAEELERHAALYRAAVERFPQAYIGEHKLLIAPELSASDCDKFVQAGKDGYSPAIMVGDIAVCASSWLSAGSLINYLIKSGGSEKAACVLFHEGFQR